MKVSNAILDWLSFTFKCSPEIEDCLEAFWQTFPELLYKRDEMVVVGGRNYAHGLCLDTFFTIRYDDDNNGKGVNVEIPSHGLKYFCDLFHFTSVRDMFQFLTDRSCTPSRIDIAMDDYTKTFYPEFFDTCFKRYLQYQRFLDPEQKRYKKCPQGLALVSKMRLGAMFHSSDGKGETFYLGDRRKRTLRIYDKSVESNGEIDAIRYECELHDVHAKAFWNHILTSEKEEVAAFGDYLLSFMDIRYINAEDGTVTRWKQYSKFGNFIKSTFSQRYVKIPAYKPQVLVEKSEHYIVTNCYSGICYMFKRHGIRSTIDAILEKGLSGKYEALLHLADKELGVFPDYKPKI